MNYPTYLLHASENVKFFEFVSDGVKGKIQKVIAYTETQTVNMYNLGFGDKDLDTGEIDDMVVSDNGDTALVLATVFKSLYLFTDEYPESWVVFTGSTESRTRLYRRLVSQNYDIIAQDFDVYGLINGKWTSFLNNESYQAFLLKRL